MIDLGQERPETIEALKHTPAAALGTCRYKIDFKKKPERAAREMDRLFKVFQAHDIRYFLYIGGNDSQDTADKIHQEALRRGYEMRVIGVPKTIDNDLPHTDHCPGFGSVAKYNACTVMEIAADVSSMATDDGSCCVIEVMGRSAGWIAARTVLAKREPDDAPHIILLPEIPFNEEAFLAKVKHRRGQCRYCIVVAGEGLKNPDGSEYSADKSRLDAFGHPVLSGAAERLGRSGLWQAAHQDPLRQTRLRPALRRPLRQRDRRGRGRRLRRSRRARRRRRQERIHGQDRSPAAARDYASTTGLQPLADIANVEHLLPRDWVSADGFLPNEKFVQYARPLIEGEVKVPTEGGLPKFAVLQNKGVTCQLPPRT